MTHALQGTAGRPVVRNPFDTIATTYLKTRPARGQGAEQHLNREIRNYFARCSAVHAVEEVFGRESFCTVYHEQFCRAPEHHLDAICKFLGLQTANRYLEDCARIVNRTPRETRWSVDWSTSTWEQVRARMEEFSWLRPYLRGS